MTMRHPERLAVLAGVALALASVLFGGCPSSMSSKGDVDTPDTKSSAEQAARRIPVVLTPVEQRVFEERLAVQGTLEAKRQLYVPARIDGPLDNIFVDEGDVVVAGETKLFKVEDIKLEEAARIRRQDLNVARCALREKEANLENAKIQLSKAERDYERFKRLHAKKAVTDDTFEQQETRYKLAKVGLEHAHTLIKLGEEQVKQAEAALAIAEKNLEDTLIYAPIDGRVSAKFKEMGEFIGTGNAVVRIEDPSVLEVSAYLPASVYAQLHPGETELRIQVSGIEVGAFPLSYKGPTIHPKLRTFEVKCIIADPPEYVVPGAMAEVAVLLERREALGVPRDAIVERGGRSVVFVVQNNRARMVEVEKGLETDGWVQLENGALAAGDPVVTMGQQQLNDGSEVDVQKGEL